MSWLSVSDDEVQVAPGASSTFVVTATTNNTAASVYEVEIKITDPGATNVTGTVLLPGAHHRDPRRDDGGS